MSTGRPPAAVAVALVAVLTLPLLVAQRFLEREGGGMSAAAAAALRVAALLFGFGFLYLPIAVLVAYSFNASRLVTVWGGFSTRWYGALLDNDKYRGAGADQPRDRGHGGDHRAGSRHLRRVRDGPFAPVSRPAPVRLHADGAAGRARGHPRPVAAVAVRRGASWFGWPASRGIVTVTIAHATFAACFVAVLVRAQLAGFDRSLEEAALDLGARP